MKRKILFGTILLFISLAFTSCEKLSGCKTCKQVSTDSQTGDVTETADTEYCGTDLISIEGKAPVTVGNVTTRWQCH